MNDLQKVLGLALLSAILDLPWLYIQGPWVQEFIRDIQADRSMNVRLWGGIPVYLALAYVVTQVSSAPRAFLLGMSIYAVYDFTQIVTFDNVSTAGKLIFSIDIGATSKQLLLELSCNLVQIVMFAFTTKLIRFVIGF